MKLDTFVARFPSFYAARNTLIMRGAPGMGKTDSIKQIATNMSTTLGVPFAVVSVIISGMDPVDLRGVLIPMKAEDGSAIVRSTKPAIWPSKFTTDVFVAGRALTQAESRAHIEKNGIPENGLLFIDEFSQADLDLQKVAAQIMLDRRVGEHVLPDGWMVVAAGNRVEDRSGVTKTLAHVQNRMFELQMQPDYEAWQSWAFRADIHPLAIGFAKANAGDVFLGAVPKESGPYCTPRSLVLCTRNLVAMKTPDMGELQLPDDTVAAEVIEGWVGAGVMPKFISHIRLGNDLPDPAEIFADPTGTKVPERIDARFVMATSLAVHASDKEKIKPVLTYIQRMDLELQVLFVRSAVSRSPGLMGVPEFTTWANKNKELIFAANS